MAFEPKNDGHAIVEAVIGLQFQRPFKQHEVEAVIQRHDEWREFLPRLARSAGFQISFGPAGGLAQPAIMPGAGVSFDRVKTDGALEWRLRIDGAAIFLNCLNYSRWREVWEHASRLVDRAAELTLAEDNKVTALIIQYIDLFEWKGSPDNYDARFLLRAGNLVPEGVLSKGPLWHLHQGWFRGEDQLGPGRLLERLHIDAVLDERGRPTVRMDSFLSFEPGEAQTFVPGAFLKNDGSGGAWFAILHDLDKKLLAEALTHETVERIGLNG
jgi:uncharacterized protein (TIGR04255 family)